MSNSIAREIHREKGLILIFALFKSSKQHCIYRPERLLICTVAQSVKYHCLWTNLHWDYWASNHKLIDDSLMLRLLLPMSRWLLVSLSVIRFANVLNWFGYWSRNVLLFFRPLQPFANSFRRSSVLI